MNEDLLRRFEKTKKILTEAWADNGLTTPPTDKEVWEQMRAVALRNHCDAMIDDMEEFAKAYQVRIRAIDEILDKL